MASDLTPSLQDLTDNIQESLNKYKNAEGSDAKAAALASIQEASGKLNDITKPVFQAMLEFQMRPYVNVATRTAIEMNIFTTLPQDGSSVNLSTLTKGAPNASEEFTLRIARVLGAFNVIAQTHDSATKEPFYAHTPLSRWISSVPGAAVTKHLFSDQVAPAVASVPNYFLKYGFASPASSKNCLYSYAHGRDDASFFDIIEKEKPEEFANFNVAMTVGPTLGLEEVIGAYDFGKLVGNKEGIVLVDVGGGQGHVLNEILKLNRELEGKVVLQDLAKVVEGGKVLDDKVLAGVQAYDFFEGVQPVKGKSFLFLLTVATVSFPFEVYLRWNYHPQFRIDIDEFLAIMMAERDQEIIAIDLELKEKVHNEWSRR